ncbi:kelch repeat-containing protein [Pseudomonas amygdali]|uniref:kelch repeat-containing protein n=1 Tax=Pseudomonas amygdali TaxID=47877 RepID=UPI003B2887B1
MDVYNIDERRCRTLDRPIPTQRAGTASVSNAGKLIVLGGESDRQVSAHSEVEALDLKSGTWETLPAMPVARHGTQAVLDGSGLHIVAGSKNRRDGPELGDHVVLEGL